MTVSEKYEKYTKKLYEENPKMDFGDFEYDFKTKFQNDFLKAKFGNETVVKLYHNQFKRIKS